MATTCLVTGATGFIGGKLVEQLLTRRGVVVHALVREGSVEKLEDRIRAGRLHHVSSIAAGGMYKGTFTESMLEEATGLDDPYLATKHESERVARQDAKVPWRVYRPGMVVGSSVTGEIDKVDGPYPDPPSLGDTMSLFAEAAHAPQFQMRIDARALQMVPKGTAGMLAALPPVAKSR